MINEENRTDFDKLRDRLQQAFNEGETIICASAPRGDYSQQATHSVARATALLGLAQTAEALLKIEEKIERSNGPKARHIDKR